MRSFTLRLTALAATLAGPLACHATQFAGDDLSGFSVHESLQSAQPHGAVAMDLLGNEVVVWNEASSDFVRVLARQYPVGHSEGGAIYQLGQYGSADGLQAPVVAASPYGGGVALMQAALGQDDRPLILAQRFGSDGMAEGSPFSIASDPEVDHSDPAVAMSRNGYHYGVTWRARDGVGRDDVMVSSYVWDSQLMTPVVVNAPGTAVGGPPQVVMGYDDTIVVVWYGSFVPGEPPNRILAQRFYQWGGRIGDTWQLVMNPGEVTDLRAAQRGDDGFAVLWRQPGAGGAQYVWLFRPGFLLERGFSVPSLGPADNPLLAVDRNDDIVVAHDTTDETFPELTRVRLVRMDGNGTVQSAKVLPGTWSGESLAGLAVDADGDTTILRNSASDQQLTRLDGTRVLHQHPVDIGLQVESQPRVHRGSGFHYDVRVRNEELYSEGEGIGHTSGMTVEVVLPPESRFEFRYDLDWICDPAQPTRAYCRYARSLGPQETSTPLLINATAPDASTDMTGHVTLRPRHLDPNSVNDAIDVVTQVRDLEPDEFAFVDRTGVARSSEQVSEEIVVSGLEAPVDLWLNAAGQYSVNDGPWANGVSQVSNGDRVRVRHTAASGFGASVSSQLLMSGVYDTFTTTTEARDTTPDAFAFADQADVNLGVPVTSAPIAVAGVNDTVMVSVSGGSYSLNGGAFTSTAGTAGAGDTIRVQHTAALTPATGTHTVLTVGGVSDTFSTTTVASDTTPDAFAFAAQGDVALGSERISVEVRISGINTAAPINVALGSYSINGAPFTTAAGTIGNGQWVRLRHTASAAFSTATTTQLVIGDVGGSFTSTTLARDVTPDAFAFAAQASVPRGSERTSEEVTISGINDAAAVAVTGGSYSIDGGPFTFAAGSIANGQRLRVRHSAASGFATTTTSTLTVGTANAAFSSTTEAQDAVPEAFAFADRSGLATAVEVISDPITVAGINVTVPVSVAGGSYSVNGGAFTTAAGSVVTGDQVRVRHVSASSANTGVTTTLTIGGVADSFTSTTGPSDSTPSGFAFADVSGAKRNKLVTSAPVTVAGINVAVPISVAGGGARWSKNGGPYTTAAGTVVAGDQVRLQLTAPNAGSFTVVVQVNIGGLADTWTVASN